MPKNLLQDQLLAQIIHDGSVAALYKRRRDWRGTAPAVPDARIGAGAGRR
jgi:hypothetical protein